MGATPTDFERSLSRVRLPLYDERLPFVCLWSEKAGCTTLVTWFLYQLGLLDDARSYSGWIHHYENMVFKKRQGYVEATVDAIINERKPLIKVVRNPVDRALSSFITLGQKQFADEKHWLRGTWRHIARWQERFPGHRGSPDDVSLSFGEFLDYVEDNDGSPFTLNPHLARQYLEGEELFVDRYVDIQHFDAFAKEVENRYGLRPTADLDLSYSPHHRRPAPGSDGTVFPEDELRISPMCFQDRNYPPYSHVLWARHHRRIFDAYGPDFLPFALTASDHADGSAQVGRGSPAP